MKLKHVKTPESKRYPNYHEGIKALGIRAMVVGAGLTMGLTMGACGSKNSDETTTKKNVETPKPRVERLSGEAPATPRKPDRDNDGIPDAQDKCPDEAGPADNNGCPKKKVKIQLKGDVASVRPPAPVTNS